MATKRMDESWKQVREQIQEIWSYAELTDQEMKKVRGNMRAMVRLIHEKTDEPQQEIFDKISAII